MNILYFFAVLVVMIPAIGSAMLCIVGKIWTHPSTIIRFNDPGAARRYVQWEFYNIKFTDNTYIQAAVLLSGVSFLVFLGCSLTFKDYVFRKFTPLDDSLVQEPDRIQKSDTSNEKTR